MKIFHVKVLVHGVTDRAVCPQVWPSHSIFLKLHFVELCHVFLYRQF